MAMALRGGVWPHLRQPTPTIMIPTVGVTRDRPTSDTTGDFTGPEWLSAAAAVEDSAGDSGDKPARNKRPSIAGERHEPLPHFFPPHCDL